VKPGKELAWIPKLGNDLSTMPEAPSGTFASGFKVVAQSFLELAMAKEANVKIE
jgi:hypothetical protein